MASLTKDVIRSLLCNPRASSPAIINIRISVPLMQDTTRARARKLLLLLLYELHSKNMTTEKEKMDEIVKVE